MELTERLADGPGTLEAGLFARARAGDHEAFGALIAPRLGRSIRIAQSILGHEADALDVVQDVFLSAWVHLADLRDPARFDPWLNQMLVNRCRDALRRRGRVREIAMEDTELTGPDHADAQHERTTLLAAFDRLSVADRQLLALRHLEDLTVDQVAARLGIPAGTVKSRLFAARRALERALETQR